MWIVIIVLRIKDKKSINIKKKRVVLWLHHNSAGMAHKKKTEKIKVKKVAHGS
jgi:hypothetical protein